MDKKFDDALRHALTPGDEAGFWLNQKIINQVKAQRIMSDRKKRVSFAALIAAFALCMGSVTVYAAWKYLSASDVAKDIQDLELSKAFFSKEALVINETQSYGDYSVTLLSMVSGDMLTDLPHVNGSGFIDADRTYAVVAIENADGAPLPDTSQEGYGKLEFFASPLIGGYNPAFYNIAGMSGNYTDMTKNGILYRLLECDNVEIFADHDLYLCVSEGMFYPKEAYDYHEQTGKISRNKEYKGLNALFRLPVERSKADPKKAAAYMANLGYEPDLSKEKLDVTLEEGFQVEGEKGHEKGVEIAEYALQFVGNPYVWGGDSLTEGTDSSGFTKSVYDYFGISLPHDSRKQCESGVAVRTLEDARPGDLIFYETPAHVGIYIGEGMVVHAMPEIGICVSEADFDTISEIRRMV